MQGSQAGDSPLYARLGYSTATCPWLDDASWQRPEEQSVSLIDADGNATHRTGWTERGVRVEGEEHPVGVGSSTAAAHWIDWADAQRLHGSGWSGTPRPAGVVTTVSLVRGPWEVRLVRVEELADGVDAGALTLRVSGWPVVDGDTLTSTVTPVLGIGVAGAVERAQASPLGSRSTAPRVDLPVAVGVWTAALITLTGASAQSATASVVVDGDTATVTWPDGITTTTQTS